MFFEAQLMHLHRDAKGVAGVASSSSRRCCPTEGQAAFRYKSPPKQGGWAEVWEMEPPAAPRRQRKTPPLLKAIENGSIAQLRAVLELSSGDAGLGCLAIDDFEPALCCAVRTRQSEEMVQMLLRYGADANESDMGGRNALCHLCDTQPRRADSEESMGMIAPTLGGAWVPAPSYFAGFDRISRPPPGSFSGLCQISTILEPEVVSSANPLSEARQLRVGTLLLAAGADIDACDLTGATPAKLAQTMGKCRLACLVQYYGVAQVMFVIGRVLGNSPARQRAGPPVGTISEGILRMICGFLAPEGSETMLLRIGALLRK
eukprot:TRINITY_DN4586_c0_g2_i7.p1 TRINITY_DN4586_c0_g2~~TRINITY_DN4586_c0_g2_i7.p1  ORF type:complete len:318 (-),score=43.80 TRINITY_DN4586_c0_g2_i7:406-1359(-)